MKGQMGVPGLGPALSRGMKSVKASQGPVFSPGAGVVGWGQVPADSCPELSA